MSAGDSTNSANRHIQYYTRVLLDDISLFIEWKGYNTHPHLDVMTVSSIVEEIKSSYRAAMGCQDPDEKQRYEDDYAAIISIHMSALHNIRSFVRTYKNETSRRDR